MIRHDTIWNAAFLLIVQFTSLASSLEQLTPINSSNVFTGAVVKTASGQLLNYETVRSGYFPAPDLTTELREPTAWEEQLGPSDEILELTNTVEVSMVLQLLGNNIMEPEHGSSVTRDIAGVGTATASYIDPSYIDPLYANGGFSVEVGSQAKIESIGVPGAVAEQFGSGAVLIVMVADMDNFVRKDNTGSPTEHLVAPVQLNIRIDNTLTKLTTLKAHVILKFVLGRVYDGRSPKCVFWSETLQQWSSQGVTTGSVSPDRKLECATTHLSMFSVILGELECSELPVLDPDNFANIGRGDWWYGPAAWATWLVLLSQCLLFCWGCCSDSRQQQIGNWNERVFMADRSIPTHIKNAEDRRSCCGCSCMRLLSSVLTTLIVKCSQELWCILQRTCRSVTQHGSCPQMSAP